VLVNGHGGNEGLLRSVSLEQSDSDMRVCAISYWDVAGDAARAAFSEDLGSVGHAGQVETALSLALRDSLPIRIDTVDFEPVTTSPRAPTSELLGRTGVIGNPAAASVQLGDQFFDAVVKGLANFLDAASKDRS
jgi:creatinine amidohydrolase/Fe(II)-dependent formamide hydrolase-like protein